MKAANFQPEQQTAKKGMPYTGSSFSLERPCTLLNIVNFSQPTLHTFVETKNARCGPPSFMQFSKRIILLDFLLLMACLAVIWAGTRADLPASAPEPDISAATLKPGDLPETELESGNTQRKVSAKVLEHTDPDTLPYIPFDPPMLQALYEQVSYLRRPDAARRSTSGIHRQDMLKTLELLKDIQLMDPHVLRETFDFYRVKTSLKSDRIRVTGYYTPLVKASRTRTDTYQFPMLRRPDSGIPSPAAIEAGALAGRNLEIGWLGSRKELSNAQLQGSCLVEFLDGQKQHYGFGGSVRGSGGTYVFFTKVDEKVLGAGFFPLTAGYSVAVDPRFIPIGSTLLAELPDLDAAGRLKGYTYRIIFAQDRGGAILTTKRVDLYCGIGHKGLQEARKINRYGRLWLLLPKER